jgi:hypothetical protein
MHKTVPPIAALVLVLGLGGPIAVGAEITSVPSTAPESSAASPPPPTILRGSRPAPSQPAAVCPPGYTLSPGYGCIGASGGDYADGSPGYSYWPDYGLGYPLGGLPAFGAGAGRFHRVARSPGFRGLPGPAGFHGPARFGGFATGAGHMGGFGHR